MANLGGDDKRLFETLFRCSFKTTLASAAHSLLMRDSGLRNQRRRVYDAGTGVARKQQSIGRKPPAEELAKGKS